VSGNGISSELLSSLSYPEGYWGPRLIFDQISMIAEAFDLSSCDAVSYAENLSGNSLPRGAEGFFAFPRIDSVRNRHFPKVRGSRERYREVVRFALTILSNSHGSNGSLGDWAKMDSVGVCDRTSRAIATISKEQSGDILVVPAQFGLFHCCYPASQAFDVFREEEFGLDCFAVACMIFTHPARLSSENQLFVDCPGNEFLPRSSERFGGVPSFCFQNDEIELRGHWPTDPADISHASVSAFSINNGVK